MELTTNLSASPRRRRLLHVIGHRRHHLQPLDAQQAISVQRFLWVKIEQW
jgi:hypothetical protein